MQSKFRHKGYFYFGHVSIYSLSNEYFSEIKQLDEDKLEVFKVPVL